MSGERRRAVEGLLNKLAGVQSVRVETAPDGRLEQIYVVATGRYSPDQQARHVESALLATLNLELDPRLISVVSFEGEDERGEVVEQAQPLRSWDERRVRLNHIGFAQDHFNVTAHVELGWEGRTIQGASEDTDTAKGRMSAVARATLNALEYVTDRRVAFFLEGLEAHETFERTIVVASLRLVSNIRKANLVGCATVDEDPNYAAAQAVLGAVNRSFSRLLVYTILPADDGEPPQSSSKRGEAQRRYAELS